MFVTAGFTVAGVRAAPEGVAIKFAGEASTPWVIPTLAVAIEPDGYFLTAAHVLGGTNVYLAYRTEQGARLARPRIVARYWNPTNGSDYAVLHVDDDLRDVFGWSSPVQSRAGLQVLAVGLSDLTTEGWISLACIGGRIRWISDPTGPVTIHSDLPTRWGDSGGPMIDASGRLLGVTLGVKGGWWRPTRTVSAMPNRNTIARILREDRGSRHESQTPFHSTSDPGDRPDLMIRL